MKNYIFDIYKDLNSKTVEMNLSGTLSILGMILVFIAGYHMIMGNVQKRDQALENIKIVEELRKMNEENKEIKKDIKELKEENKEETTKDIKDMTGKELDEKIEETKNEIIELKNLLNETEKEIDKENQKLALSLR